MIQVYKRKMEEENERSLLSFKSLSTNNKEQSYPLGVLQEHGEETLQDAGGQGEGRARGWEWAGRGQGEGLGVVSCCVVCFVVSSGSILLSKPPLN